MKRFLVFAGILVFGLVLAATVVSSSPENDGRAAVDAAAAIVGYDRVVDVTIPVDTVLKLRLEEGFGSDTSRAADRVLARLVEPIRFNGRDLIMAGSSVSGYVTTATRAASRKGQAKLGLRFDGIQPPRSAERYQMVTRPWIAVAPPNRGRDLHVASGATLEVALAAPLTVHMDR